LVGLERWLMSERKDPHDSTSSPKDRQIKFEYTFLILIT
jgi:hypothetical protein